MTSMAIWNFGQPENQHIALKPKTFGFREFLKRQYGVGNEVSSEVKSLFGQAKAMFGIGSIEEAFDYLETRINDELVELFPLITGSLYLTQEEREKIKDAIDSNLISTYPISSNTGLNECLALYLRGLYELNFDNTYECVFKGIYNICGSVVPFIKGKIAPIESTIFQDDLDYQDRVLFSIIVHEFVAKLKASAINARLFKTGTYTELGNPLCHNINMLGIAKKGAIYNYMRIVLDHRNAHTQSRFICDSLDYNLFYTQNTKTLEQASLEGANINVGDLFDHHYNLIMESLTIVKLSQSTTGIDNARHTYKQYACHLYKNFLYIQSLMPKYLAEIQYTALRRHYIDSMALVLRNILQEVIFANATPDQIEIIFYEIAKHLESMVLAEYGEQNKYCHILHCFNDLGKAVDSPIHRTNLKEHFNWFNMNQIQVSKSLFNAYETAAKAGSLSAKIALAICYANTNVNTAASKAKAVALEAEFMEIGAPLILFGVSFDINGVFSGKVGFPGINKETTSAYIKNKIHAYDFSRPDMVVRYRNLQHELMLDEIEEKLEVEGSLDVEDLTGQQVTDYLNNFANEFPFVKNTLALLESATETTAIWLIAAECGCALSAFYLFDDIPGVGINAFPFEFEDLINPDLQGSLLNPANWNRYGVDMQRMNLIKNKIDKSVSDKYYESCEHAMEVFTEYDHYIGQIIKSGNLPSIEQVGIFINLYICLIHLAKNLSCMEVIVNKARHKELTVTFHKFLIDYSIMDWNVVSHTRLTDVFNTRSNNQMLNRMITLFSKSRQRPELENILTSPGLAIKWCDSLTDLLPDFDTPLGIVCTQYLQWTTQTIQAACKADNHLDSCQSRLWVNMLYSLIFLHSHAYFDVEQQIQKKNMSREDIQNKTMGISMHKKYVHNMRRILKNTPTLDECLDEFKRILSRGSLGAAEVYHSIVNGEVAGKEEFFPHNTAILLRAASSIAQTETVQFITPNVRNCIAPYMMLILIMRLREGGEETLETRKYLLDCLVRYKDGMGLVFNVYDAYHSENKVASTGYAFEDAVALVREHAVAHRHIIQLLGVKLDDLTIKFPQAKLKFKLSEITPDQWLEALTHSGEYFKY